MTARRVVSYRTLGLGDLLTAVPALRAVSRAFPDHDRVAVVSDWLVPLAAVARTGHRFHGSGELEPLPDDLHAPDLAVNLHGCGPQSHRLLLAAGPGRLIGHHHPDVPGTASAPRWRDDDHEVVRWCRLLEEVGIPADPTDLHLPVPDGDAPAGAVGATVVHPGAKSGARRWPAERFAAVAAAERRAGRRVLVTGSPPERALAGRVVRAAGLPPTANLAGTMDLVGLARVVGHAGRVVCGDTGVAHLATALRTPSVVLFGPTPPAQWGPPPHLRQRHRVLWAGRSGDPLADEPFDGLLEITVDDVTTELAALEPSRRRAG